MAVANDWAPFGMTDEEQAEYAVLVLGLPGWLREPVIGWLGPYVDYGGWIHTPRCLDIQTRTRVSLEVVAGQDRSTSRFNLTLRQMPDLSLLRVLDYVVSKEGFGSPRLDVLDRILKDGRSKWTVGDRLGEPGLVERVPAGVQDAVEGTIASSGSAGKVLARAWANVHGLEPQDSAAYANAVRAVEIAAIAVVQPKNTAATLGTVIGQIKADGDWRLPLREHPLAPSADMIIALCRTLWQGHRDRHGSVNYSDVTHEEARAAVTLAATLVDWFSSGAIVRR